MFRRVELEHCARLLTLFFLVRESEKERDRGWRRARVGARRVCARLAPFWAV